jgi:arylformamidase
VDERESRTLDVHHALFDNGAYVLENLDLRGVEPGRYELIALPQRLAGLDAAPVRALLRTAAPERR